MRSHGKRDWTAKPRLICRKPIDREWPEKSGWMDFPLWEEKLESGPGIEEKGSRICVESMGNRKCLSGASKIHKELPGGLPGTELEGPLCRTLSVVLTGPVSGQSQ